MCVCVLKNAKFHFLMTTCFCCGSCCSATSLVRIFAAPWTVALQAPLFMGFPRQEYWDGLSFPFLRDLPDPVNSCLLHCRWILDLWAPRKGAIMGLCLCACQVTSAVSNTLQPFWLYPASLLCFWDSPGKNMRVGCHGLFQRIFMTQELNPCLLLLLHWQVGSLH